MSYRAILDGDNICIGLCSDSPLISEGIEVSYDVTGMRYNNGEWETIDVGFNPTQLDRIEAQVNSIAENGTSWDSMAAAINEGVNEV